MSIPEFAINNRAKLLAAAAVAFLLAGCGDDDIGGDDDDNNSEDDDDASGDDDDDSSNVGPVCGENDFSLAREPVDMLILLDRSNSMTIDSLWEPMKSAIEEITSTMKVAINFGLLMFPDQSVPGSVDMSEAHLLCTQSNTQQPQVPVQPYPMNTSDDIVSAMDDAGTAGSTPTAAALSAALNYMNSLDDQYGKYVLLATDGAPNCNFNAVAGCPSCTAPSNIGCSAPTGSPLFCLDDQTTNAAAKGLFDSGFPVYVLGVGTDVNSQWASVMTAIAKSGGTENYFAAEETSAILDQFQEILGKVISCEFEVDWESLDEKADPGQVNLFCKMSTSEENTSGNVIGWDKDCKKGTGWDWIDEDNIKFCDKICTSLKAGSCFAVSATFGCDTVVE